MTLYRNIIKGSWKSTIRNKYLWFFGLFAVLLGNGGEYQIFFQSMSSEKNSDSIWLNFFGQIFNYQVITSIGKRFWENPFFTFTIMVSILFILVVFLFVVWMMSVSQIAIVNAITREAREKDHNLVIGLRKGIVNFWPVFLLNLTVKALVVVVLAALVTMGNFALHVISIVIMIPLMISLSFIAKYAIAFIVVRKEKFIIALTSAWKLFRKNWIISLELAFLLYLFSFGAGLLFMFASFNIIPFFQVLANVFSESAPAVAFNIFYVGMPLTLFMVLAFIGSLLAVFQISAWTKLFLELDSKGAKSKIERIFSK